MPKVTNFEHNGVTLQTSESPEAIGGLGNNVVCLVGTAPNAHVSIPRNVPFRINDFTTQALLDTTNAESGTLFQAVYQILKVTKVPVYVIVVEKGTTDALTQTNVIGGVDAVSGQRKGIAAIPLCQEMPTIIGAPGFSSVKAVHSELASMAARIRCRFVFDGLDVTVAAQVTNSESMGAAGYERGYMVHQMAAVYSKAAQGSVFLPPSVLAIAHMAKRKPWESPGNQVTYAEGVSRTVEYIISDSSTEGDLLNSYGVSYYARTELGGFSLIGNRSISGKFISFVGLEDALARKLIGSAQKGMAQNLTKKFMEQEVERYNTWLQGLVADETIPGGKVYLHPDLNTVEKYKNGTWYVVFDYGRYSPNENMVMQLNAKDSIIETFLEDVL